MLFRCVIGTKIPTNTDKTSIGNDTLLKKKNTKNGNVTEAVIDDRDTYPVRISITINIATATKTACG